MGIALVIGCWKEVCKILDRARGHWIHSLESEWFAAIGAFKAMGGRVRRWKP